MNKKGFTLIEVITVIALMGVLVGIAVPAIYTIAKNYKENLKEKQLDNILNIASLYFQDNSDEVKNNTKINLSELVDNGYLDDNDLIDPTSNSQFTNDIKVKVKKLTQNDECDGKVVHITDGETYCLTIKKEE